MTRLIIRSLLLVTLNVGCALGYVGTLESSRRFAPWESMSALHRMPNDKESLCVFLGSSRAYRFAHCLESQLAVSNALGGDVVHLSKTASGILQQRLFLEEYFRRDNRTENVICFLDPFVFFSRDWNETMPYIEHEPLDISFAWSMWRSGVEVGRLHAYAQSKFRPNWYRLRPRRMLCEKRQLRSVRPDFVREQLKLLYPDGVTRRELDRYMKELDGLIELAHARGAKVVLMSTPTLLGPVPGYAAFREALRQREANYDVRYFEFRDAIQDLALFRDHDHLNANGIETFMTDFVAPALLLQKEKREIRRNER